MDTKIEMRKAMKKKLLELDPAVHKRKSEKMADFLFSLPIWREAKHIGITVSRGFEVDTKPIIQKAWDEGKKVSVPKCSSVGERLMDFHRILSFDELENVYMDLYEPIIGKTELTPPSQMDLMVVPGLIFSPEGYRIGFGGGFYDRYLEGFKGHKLSLAFDIQLVPSVPVEPFDIPVQWLVTNHGVQKAEA